MSEIFDVFDDTATSSGWLGDDELAQARERLPIVYVDAVPVRVSVAGELTHVGTLLRAMPDGRISRAVVSGRVLYGERIRDALLRHIEKDLGPMALPRIPIAPQPFTVAEYFPDPTVTGFHDPRQHAVALAYVVACDGDCVPSSQALDLAWMTPQEVLDATVLGEMSGGQGLLVRRALAHCGVGTI